MARIYKLTCPVRDTHGNIHSKDKVVRFSRNIDRLGDTLLEMVDSEGHKILVIPEEVTEIGEE